MIAPHPGKPRWSRDEHRVALPAESAELTVEIETMAASAAQFARVLAMNKSARIRQLLREHPEATVSEIAIQVGCMPEYVRTVRARNGGLRPCDVAWDARRDREALRQNAREYQRRTGQSRKYQQRKRAQLRAAGTSEYRRRKERARALAHADLPALAAASTLKEPSQT